jgi:muconolactone delta-isomerase
MRFLVTMTPKHQVPLENLPGMLDAAIAWHDRHSDHFESFGTFVGGGGFGVVNAADERELNQMLVEMPFMTLSHVDVRVALEGVTGMHQAKDAFSAMMPAHS